jgi:hypothetical protein
LSIFTFIPEKSIIGLPLTPFSVRVTPFSVAFNAAILFSEAAALVSNAAILLSDAAFFFVEFFDTFFYGATGKRDANSQRRPNSRREDGHYADAFHRTVL